MVLCAVFLCGCFSDDGPEYDIPLRSRVTQANIAIDADGSTLVLAEIGMNYGTRDKLGEWDSPYRTLNQQSILYSNRGGAWTAHPFRNLDPYGQGGSLLFRNDQGGVQPLLWDNGKRVLYARSGDDWIRKGAGAEQEFNNWTGSVLLNGDSGWQSIAMHFPDQKAELVSNLGATVALDSGFYLQSPEFFHGKSVDLMVASITPSGSIATLNDPQPTGNESSEIWPQLWIYSWSRAPGHGPAQKRLLRPEPGYYSGILRATVSGEERLYVRQGLDTLQVFALREDAFVRLGDVAFPSRASDPGHADLISTGPNIGPDGCIHQLLFADGSHKFVADSYLHVSSCSDAADTLAVPDAVKAANANPNLSGIRFDKDGKPMVLLLNYIQDRMDYQSDTAIGPSGIYLARPSTGPKWKWETVVEF